MYGMIPKAKIEALENAPPENVPYIWGARVLMISIAIILMLLVKKAWENNYNEVK